MGAGSAEPASTPTGAVFLSYASQDAEAAQKICEALRAAGIEVWFDQSELRGGDAWDQSIRKQIKTCALFIPVISHATHDRREGYFRLEWKLAVDRSHLMDAEMAFLLPVVIDDTGNDDDRVPERFREVQWTRLRGGEATPTFVSRIAGLLSHDPAASASGAASTPVVPPFRAERNRRRYAWLAVGVSTVIVVTGSAYYFLARPHGGYGQRGTSERVTASEASVGVPEKSIAVLPFVDMSESHDQEYFGDGLADQVLNELSRIPALKVIGRTSSFRFKGKADDLRDLGKALGAVYVLEGSVRSTGQQLRITAQLINTRDGSHLWSQFYDRNFGNVLQLQEEIASAIARTLQVTITDYFKQQYTTKSPEAFDLYLRGVRDIDLATAESTRRAVTEFERATQLDPMFVSAIIGQAFAYNEMVGNGYMAAGEAHPRARLLIDRALAIDPHNADAYAMRALIRINSDRDWSGASADIANAQELGGSRLAYLPAAKLAGAKGDIAGAAKLFEAQLAIDPLDSESLQDLGWVVYPALGRYEEADAVLKRAHEVDPEYTSAVAYFVGINLLLRGRLDEAATLIEAEKDESSRDALRASVEHARRRSRDSDAAMGRAIAAPNAWSWAIARAYAYRGDNPKAVEWLERAAAEHEPLIWTVRSDPMLRTLAGDKDFAAFLRKINIRE